jgi:hypothetical protein
MRPASDSFFTALRGAHQICVRARVCVPGQTGIDPDGVEIPVLAGNVIMDATANITSTLELTTVYDWPRDTDSFGTPYGAEIYVERGVIHSAGVSEYVGLGYFRVDKVRQARTPNGAIQISGTDRMSSVIDARAMQPRVFGAGASVAGVISDLVGELMPSIPAIYDYSAGTDFLGSQHIFDDDRLAFIQDLLNSRAKIAYFDYAGRLQIKARPDPSTTPSVWDVNAGRNGVLVEMQREISRAEVYNAVVARGEAAGENPPVQGFAYDDAPTSPTRFGGPFGQVPKFYSSSFLTTNDQCTAAAASMLLTATGLPYNVSLGLVPNPALEASDVIAVTYDQRENTELHIIDRLTIPLDPSTAMTIDTRKQEL